MSAGKILIVDKDSELINKVESYLKLRGYDVIFAINDSDALEKARQSPDLIFLVGTTTPGLNLPDLLVKLRNDIDSAAVPITIVVSEGKYEFIRKLQALGATDFIFKPATLDKLSASVEKWLGSDQ